MQQSNRKLYIGLGVLVIIIAIGALLLSSNPDLFGRAGGQGRGNAFGLTRQAQHSGSTGANTNTNGNTDTTDGNSQTIVDPTEDSVVEDIEIQLDDPDQPQSSNNNNQSPAVTATRTDIDGDGLSNVDDQCPTEGGPSQNGGCPVSPTDQTQPTAVPATNEPEPTVVPFATNLNATSAANMANTGGTATQVVDHINATSTSVVAGATAVANLLNATAAVNATGTQIADTMMATGTQIVVDQTQIATNLNATPVANMANTGGTATQVVDHINATSTSVVASATAVANLLNATAAVNATGTQIADTMMATGIQIAIDQTQIATNLNATSVANMANTGGTATQVVDHINATSTSVVASATAVANLLNATAEVNATGTQIADTMMATGTQIAIDQTQIATNLNVMSVANMANTGGTATQVADHINATSTSVVASATAVANLLNATAEVNATGTQIADTMMATGTQIAIDQTQIATNLNGTSVANMANTGGTATQVADHINATSTSVVASATAVANLLNATAEVNATGTQIADTMMATGTQIAIDQTQIATNLNATSVANMANTGGTATQVADHINATSTSVVASATAVANLLNATAEVNAAQTATVTGNTAGTQATPADANATTVAGQATVVPTAVPQGSPSAPQTSGIVTPLVGLNVHTTPAVTAPVVTAIAQGSAVNITRRSDDGRWLEIHFDDGSAGWVLAEYVDESDAGGASKGTLGQCSGITDAPQDVVDALDAVLSDFIDPTPGEYLIDIPPAPGVVIRVESPDWVYFEAAGFANVETGEPLNCEMPFQIGSNTKMMTATVLLQLQEEGLLSLDNMLADYLPDYAERFPNGDQMTLRQLANHTAGLGDYGDPIIGAGVSDLEARERGYTPEELLEFALENTEPSFAPGTDGAWSYSNTGYILLGLIIEDVTEQALEDVFADRIFTPLGMDDTFFWNDSSLPEFGLPANYIEAPFEEEVSSWNMSQGWAAGAVISTADDMATFITALMNGELYEDEATLDMMTDAVYAEGLLANYGIGFMSRITIHSEDTWGHGGQTLGFESVVEYDVADDISIVIWTNAGNDLAVIGDIVIDQALLDAGIIDD